MTEGYGWKFGIAAIFTAAFMTACGGGGGDSNTSPIALAKAQPSTDQLTTFKFSSDGSKDSDGLIVKYAWTFGDGSTSTDPSPTHVYPGTGKYKATLTVTDNLGSTAASSVDISIDAVATSATSIPTAQTISLPGIATIQIADASFSSPTTIGVWMTAKPETAAEFSDSSVMFSSAVRASSELRINTAKVEPKKTIQISARLPAELEARMSPKDEPKVFVQVYQTGGLSILDTFELIDSTYDAAAKTLQFSVDPGMFTDRRTGDDSWEAIVVIGATSTKPSVAKSQDASEGKDGRPEIPLPWPEIASNEKGIVQLFAGDPVESCNGGTLRAPLDSMTVVSAYNPPKHYGVDYRATSGTEVKAMADGKVVVVGNDERPLQKPDPRSGKLVKGWGRYVVIEHTDGSKSLYAHLEPAQRGIKVAVGSDIKAGAVIALSDNSGGSEAPHLHVEYAPNGEIFKKASKVDANACVSNTATGNITVSDNGNLADDAFGIAVNGKQVCVTTIGATNTCAVGALRAGTASLTITAVIAPDNVGTYLIALSSGLTFQNGTTSVSGTIAQGGSATFVLKIP